MGTHAAEAPLSHSPTRSPAQLGTWGWTLESGDPHMGGCCYLILTDMETVAQIG